jgi:hypothetical protein
MKLAAALALLAALIVIRLRHHATERLPFVIDNDRDWLMEHTEGWRW